MKSYLEKLPAFTQAIADIREILISNIVLIGQIPAPSFQEERRVAFMLERMAELGADECTTDSFGNAVGILRGRSKTAPPIFLVAHLDTFSKVDLEHNYIVSEQSIRGEGVSDNSAGVGALISLPEIIKRMELGFESDLVLVGTVQSLGRGNLRGIRKLLKNWDGPIRGAVCLESVELGRLNYFSDGMIRAEVHCSIATEERWEHQYKPNAILMLNEVINQILAIRLPQKPRTRIVIGKIAGGFDHGKIAYDASIGFEIRSDSYEMVREIYAEIRDIVEGVTKEFEVDLSLNRISNLNAARLKFNHPLVKAGTQILKELAIEPISEPTESALSIFLHRKIPAVTVGLTHGDNYHQDDAMIEIAPMYKGLAQVLALIMAIDEGVCDAEKLA